MLRSTNLVAPYRNEVCTESFKGESAFALKIDMSTDRNIKFLWIEFQISGIICSHIDAGKTTTTERILFSLVKPTKLVRCMKVSATMDWMEQRAKNAASQSSLGNPNLWTRYFDTHLAKGSYRFNIIDTIQDTLILLQK